MDIHETLKALSREGMSVRTIATRIQCSTSHVRTLLAGRGEYIPVRSVALLEQLRIELEQRQAAEVAAAISQAIPDEAPLETLAADPTSCAGTSELEAQAPSMPPAPAGGWWARLFRRPARAPAGDIQQQRR